jgi:hypothetical protein
MRVIKLTLMGLAIASSLLFSGAVSAQQYIVIGWNDLGMHCANKYFGKIAVLPPYNNVYAQIIKKQNGQLPQIMTAGFTVEYSIPYNTYSVGKTDFWTYAQQLFGLASPLPANIGLTGKGLTGVLDPNTGFFRAEGIPVTPFKDTNLTQEKPFQTIHLIAKNSGGTPVSTTDCVIPVSNEIGCVSSGCHASEQSILNSHESVNGFNSNGPVLCASCHGSPALGTTGDTVNAKWFSYRIHNTHKNLLPANDINTCYKCHPGPNTRCLRDVMSQNQNNPLICQSCHGTMANVASTILAGRKPWVNEPSCGSTACHGSNFAEEPGKLFKNSKGHGGVYCEGCHGSTHAITPSREANDNIQSINLQGHAGAISDCMVCHSSPPSGPGPHGFMYTGIRNTGSATPGNFRLYQNYPNPFNPSTKIKFDVPTNTFVTLKVYNVLGKEIATLVSENLAAGTYETNWNASEQNSGIYFTRIITDKYQETRKMILVK